METFSEWLKRRNEIFDDENDDSDDVNQDMLYRQNRSRGLSAKLRPGEPSTFVSPEEITGFQTHGRKYRPEYSSPEELFFRKYRVQIGTPEAKKILKKFGMTRDPQTHILALNRSLRPLAQG